MDEVEFTAHIHEIILASAPAFGKAASNAKRNKAVHGRILISTPGDLDDAPTQEALKIIKTTAQWTEQMYDMSKGEMKSYLDANTGNSPCPIVYVEYNYKQLGEGQEWFNRQCGLLLHDKIAIRREILLQRVNGSNNSPFDMADLMAITDSKKRPIREEIIMGKYKLDIYEEIDKRKVVCISIDTSTGIGQDSNAITVINPHTKRPIAEFSCRYMSSVDLRKFVYILVKKYYPNAFIVPERNMGGYALVDELMETDISHQIYFENVTSIESTMDDRLDSHGFLKQDAMQRKIRGVQTTGKNREMMMKILNTHVREHKDTFVTQNIIADLNNLVLTSGGKVEAAKGKHDDSIMSFLIGLYVIYYGKNLARFGYVPGLTDEDKARMNTGIHQTFETDILTQLQEQVDQGIIDERFVDGFKTGSKSDMDSYNEYEQAIIQARARMAAYEDPYAISQSRNLGTDEADIYSNKGSIPGSFFTELNS